MIKRIISTSTYSLFSRFFITASNLYLIFFISRYMGKGDLGTYGILFFFFQLFSFLSSMNLYLFFGKEIANVKDDSICWEKYFHEFISATTIGFFLSLFFLVLFGLTYSKVSLILLVLSFIAGVFLGMERNLGGIVLGREKMNVEFYANFFSFLLIISLLILKPNFFNSLEKIFILRITALISSVIIKIIFIKDMIIFKNFRIRLQFFREGKFYWFTGISNLLIRQIDIFILSFFISRSLLGAYFLALRIYFSFGIIGEVITMALTPFISRTYRGKEKRGFIEFNRKLFKIFFVIALFSAVFLFLSRSFIVSLFSTEYIADTSFYLLFLSFLIFFRFFSYSTGSILTSTEFQNIRFYIVVISAVVIIVLNLISAPLFGINGVLISRGIVEIFIFFGYGYFVRKILKEYKIKT
ncbi:MAG: polysaccharide biosynthesis C-terminal domain-containing protein [Acidobacteriota bacterium]